ncbi:MAG: aminotransferase class III-fold pyridoxal phosphate-dependent enzyme, partial [Deltaproteobacteria bacterium]|nr:aminotransferase class III-fold pyridoxal phosphate-dependent enzyme [Deltaproteobacteria bacterium]
AMLAKEELNSVFGPGSHATTFGGTPLVTAVAEAVIRSILEDGILEKCSETGQYFRKRLYELREKYKFIKDVRGYGLINGLELTIPGAGIVSECMARGFLVVCAHETVLRFVPPLIISREEVDLFINCLNEIFGNIK